MRRQRVRGVTKTFFGTIPASSVVFRSRPWSTGATASRASNASRPQADRPQAAGSAAAGPQATNPSTDPRATLFSPEARRHLDSLPLTTRQELLSVFRRARVQQERLTADLRQAREEIRRLKRDIELVQKDSSDESSENEDMPDVTGTGGDDWVNSDSANLSVDVRPLPKRRRRTRL